MKRWIAALLLAVWWPISASAQAPGDTPKFGVLSLISDTLSVVTYQRLTDANSREAIPLTERL